MKGKWLKVSFALLGMSGIMTACYGVPHSDFRHRVSGTITDTKGNPLKGIQVSAEDEYEQLIGRDITDSYGSYRILTPEEYKSENLIIRATDIDGEENGGLFNGASANSEGPYDHLDFELKRFDE